MLRKIVKIDDALCDGCGLCVTSCAEGAIQVIDGKARLVSDIYCDGLGNCLGECPQGAITIEEREAPGFDPRAVEQRLNKKPEAPTGGCPGSLSRMLNPQTAAEANASDSPSALGNWPVQLRLAPIQAPYFQNANLLIAADCAPFAYPDFHRNLLAGKTLLIGCPKLDDGQFYLEKLAQIFRANEIQSIEIAYMEVPCCHGLVSLVRLALRESGKNLPIALTQIAIDGARS